MASMSMGKAPAVWAVSSRNSRPFSRQKVPTSAAGSRVPQTLLAWSITTARVFSRSRPGRRSVISVPSGRQGIRSKVTPRRVNWVRGRMTALCSMADTSTWSPGRSRPFSRTFRLSVMFLVNATHRLSGPWNRRHSCWRVRSTVSSA